MKKRQGIHNAVLAVFLGVFATCGFAQVVEGQDDATHNNNTPAAAQRLTINADAAGTTGGASVQGVLGNLSGSAVADLDFYSFYGRAGDVVTIDIDGGIGGARSVDTILAIFGPAPQYAKKRENDDASSPVDEGSTSRMDSRIDNFTLDVDGVYTIGVSSWPRFFNDGGTLTSTSLNSRSNGDYTLNITGVSLPMVFISIEIKPGSGERAPINPKAKGVVPVALLGSSRFNALAVKRDSLRFGTTGYESSWLRCAKEGEDVNSDGYLDLVCHFDNRLTKFVKGDLEGILRGETGDGYQLEGRGLLKVVPEKREDL